MRILYKMLCMAFMITLGTLITAHAQPTVTGVVTDVNGPISGVSVSVLGTNKGTQTDSDGRFSIQANKGDSLQFSIVGYKRQTAIVESSMTLYITLMEDASELSEVVVTALGIRRERKSLGYAFQEIKGSDLADRKENNIANALTGQIAGLQVVRGSNGPAGSSKLVLRGFNSLTGSNQPLIVVDGIPLDNFTGAENNDYWNPGTDMGNGLADINPEDIETLSILKGGAASALYGSRAGNGVIVITTKKGRPSQGVGISYSTTVGFETIFMKPELQSAFGRGLNFEDNDPQNTRSWGPKIEGQTYTKWDGTQTNMQAYDNIANFFNTGFNTTHNLGFQQQISESTSLYTSGTYLHDNSRVPGAKLNRLNVSTRAVSNFGPSKKWTTDFKVQYINNKATNRPLSGNNTSNYFSNILLFPRSVDIRDLSPGIDGEGNHFYYIENSSAINPYWAKEYNLNQDSRDRFLLNGSIKYQFNDWLSGEVRGGSDMFTTRTQTKLYASQSDLYPTNMPNGSYSYGIRSFIEKNYIASLTASKDNVVGKFGGTLSVFGQIMERRTNFISANAGELEVPNLFSVNNGKNAPSVSETVNRKQINSLFGTFEVNYDNFWFVNFTARNDWSSALMRENRSFFYPSISTSLVISDMITNSGGSFPSWFTFAKLRASYASVGNDLPPYELLNTFNIGKDPNNNTTASRKNTLFNENIVSELIKNVEVGFETRFLNNRIGLDLTYYKSNATNQIIGLPMNPLSGYQFRRVNAGNIQNQGVEMIFNARILDVPQKLTWDMTVNFARNRNKIVELYDDVRVYSLGGYDDVRINAVVGENYGEIWGLKFRRVEDQASPDFGKLLLQPNGLPQATTESHRLGNQSPNALLGISNTFTYKDFAFSFLIDGRFGGEIFSATNFLLQYNGAAAVTVANGEREDFVVDGVIPDPDNAGKYLPNEQAVSHQNYWGAIAINNLGITEANIYDATNIRLRNVALNYTIPTRILGRSVIKRAKVGISSNNVWMISSHMRGIDPESVYATGTNAIGFENFAPPSGRSYFFNVSLSF